MVLDDRRSSGGGARLIDGGGTWCNEGRTVGTGPNLVWAMAIPLVLESNAPLEQSQRGYEGLTTELGSEI